jgi:hypothetical protein
LSSVRTYSLSPHIFIYTYSMESLQFQRWVNF